ncbi:MAG TPA: ADP-polyphosphate phosphotransferase [Verrucomicrobiae bacterium]|jgi:PPK2 family polyphosphate:nucleotide phosphotransferase
MKIKSKDFRTQRGSKIKLKRWPTRVEPYFGSKDAYEEMLEESVDELSSQQGLLYASAKYALLLIFQGMDAAGKDGIIRHVMSGVNPQGCEVVSFKEPNSEELKHDFLWRTTCNLPQRGQIGIFNRSYYEEVLITKVHPEILANEGISKESADSKEFWECRYRSIVEFEGHLHRNGTRVIKFFLHLSKHEQRRRFLERIEEPEKNWKFSAADIRERKYWDNYTKAYEDCIEATTTRDTPWHIVPADDKKNARLIVSHIILDELKDLKLTPPSSSAAHRRELNSALKQL